MLLLSHTENTVKQDNQKLFQKSIFAFSYILETSGKTVVSRHAEEWSTEKHQTIPLQYCHFKNDLQYCDDTHQIISVLQNAYSFSHSCLELSIHREHKLRRKKGNKINKPNSTFLNPANSTIHHYQVKFPD